MKITEKAVCLGFELDKTTIKCRLCGFMSTIMANLISHIKKVHDIDFQLKLCNGSVSRYRGCRKIFTKDSFDLHTCTLETPVPEQILEPSFEQEEKNGHENQLKLKVKTELSLLQPPVQSPPLSSTDNFRAATTLTLLIEPATFHRSKVFKHSTNKACFSSSLKTSMEFLLSLSCHVYPPQEEESLASCHVAIQPYQGLRYHPTLLASYTSHTSTRTIRSNKRGWGVREAQVKTLFYTNQAGLTLQCQNQKNAFLEVNSGKNVVFC